MVNNTLDTTLPTRIGGLRSIILKIQHSLNNVFLKISQNTQKYTCARVSFLIKLQVSFIDLNVSRTVWMD